MFVLFALTTFVIWRTPWGLRVRSTGENPHAVETLGINPLRVRYIAVVIGGLIAGLAGAWFSLETVGSFEDGMTGGRGFIALAALIFGKWRPWPAFGGAMLFGFSDALGTRVQIFNVEPRRVPDPQPVPAAPAVRGDDDRARGRDRHGQPARCGRPAVPALAVSRVPLAPRRRVSRRVIGALLLAGFVLLAARFAGPLHTLEPDYTDHARHTYAAWSSLSIGTRIWTDPVVEWDVEARSVVERWPTMPHSYPPASVLVFLPFGVVANTGLLPVEVVNVLAVALFGAAGVWAALLLWRALEPAYPRALALVVVVLAAVELVKWGLDGFFDTAAVGCALAGIVALQRGRDRNALLWLALAFGLHFRLWYLAPVLVLAAVRHRRFDVASGIAALLLVASAVTAVWLRPALVALPDAAEFVPNPLQPALLPLLLGVALAGVVWFSERDLVVTATTVLAVATAVLTPQWQSWYPLAYLPLLALPRTATGQGALVAAWVALALQGPGALDVVATVRQLVAAVT